MQARPPPPRLARHVNGPIGYLLSQVGDQARTGIGGRGSADAGLSGTVGRYCPEGGQVSATR